MKINRKVLLFAFIPLALSLAYSAANAQSSIEDGNYVGVNTGIGLVSSSLLGAGFNSDLPSRTGLLYGLEFSHQLKESSTRFGFNYNKVSAKYSSPSGLTPSSMTEYREEFGLTASFAPWDSGHLQSLRWVLGYRHSRSGATETAPSNALTVQTSQGLSLGLQHSLKFMNEWNLVSAATVYLPHIVRENPQATGYNAKYLGLEAKASVEYLFSDEILAYLGAGYRVDEVSYDGTATRSVTGGRDTRKSFSFPIGIKYGY